MTNPDNGTADKSPDQDATLPFIDDREAPQYSAPKKGATLEMATPRVTELAKTALELRMQDLAGLAKKNLAEGYPAAARTQTIDASVIKTELLPQLQRQLTLLAGHAEGMSLPDRLTDAFRPSIENALRTSWQVARAAKQDRPDDSLIDHARRVADGLAGKVNDFAMELYMLAYEAGLSERHSSFEHIASRAVSQLG